MDNDVQLDPGKHRTIRQRERLESLEVDNISNQKVDFYSSWSYVSSCRPYEVTLLKRLDEKSAIGSIFQLPTLFKLLLSFPLAATVSGCKNSGSPGRCFFVKRSFRPSRFDSGYMLFRQSRYSQVHCQSSSEDCRRQDRADLHSMRMQPTWHALGELSLDKCRSTSSLSCCHVGFFSACEDFFTSKIGTKNQFDRSGMSLLGAVRAC